MNEKHKIIAFFIMIDVALLGCSNAVEEASDLDVTPPEIRATTPTNNTTDYGVQGEISVEFNEAMDKSTLSTDGLAAFTLYCTKKDQTEPESVSGFVNYSLGNYIATYSLYFRRAVAPRRNMRRDGEYLRRRYQRKPLA